jgi:arylsulfatase A-like enzyme
MVDKRNKMKKQNILFIGIDSFRSDKCFGKTKTSKTPNIDRLIENGVYFDQHISVSDGSYTCMGAVFTSQYPFQSGITTVSAYSKSTKIFDKFRKAGYKLYGTAPCTPFFINLLDSFDEKENFSKPGYLYPESGNNKESKTGEFILERLDRIKNGEIKEPWFYFIFLMDLHRSVSYNLPDDFNSEIFGETNYEKMVSMLDVWIGKFLERIDLENTLVILTSDHGEFIPTPKVGHELTYIPELFEPGKIMKEKTPKFLHGIYAIGYRFLRYFAIPIKNQKYKKELTPIEQKSLNTRGHSSLWILPDDTVRTPLILSGNVIKNKNKIINQQIGSIDILPTIANIISIDFDYENAEGRSVLPLINGKKLEEKPIFIENAVRRNPTKPGNCIGVRTSDFKYYRARNNSKKKVSLYNLKQDPDEIVNIASERKDIVEKMEKLLEDIRKNSIREEEIDIKETQRIEKDLKPLGKA